MNNKQQKTLSEEYPSLKLGYNHVKDILIQQRETIRDYGARAITLLAAATAIIGIGIPIGYAQGLEDVTLFSHYTGRDIAIVPILLYVLIAMHAWAAYRFREIKTMNNPVMIFHEFIKRDPDEFLYELLIHIGNAFKHNRNIIEMKQRYLKILVPLVIAEAVVVVLWIAVVSLLIPAS